MQNVAIQDKNILQLFPEVAQSGKLAEIFRETKIIGINVYKKTRRLEIHIACDTLIPFKAVSELEKKLRESFGLDSVIVKPKFSVELSLQEVLDQYWESILFMINSRVALSRGIMAGCTCELQDKKLRIHLKTNGTAILRIRNCDQMIESILEESFGVSAKVEFVDFTLDEESIVKYLSKKEDEEARVVSDAMAGYSVPSSPEGEAKPKEQKAVDPGGIILGKNFTDSIMKMSDVTQDSGKVAICGDIFRVEAKELRSGKFIYMFDITDYSSSVSVKFFVEKDDIEYIQENVKEGLYAKVRGEAQYDKFTRELTIMASDIIQMQKTMKMDTAEVKRVELHLHTQMSTMDGITPTKELVKRAAQWGHKAIAITDHGVVQAYPDAFDAGKKHKIKIIYGVECYILDDNVPSVLNSNNQSLDGDFVVFDIETTGLHSDRDKITEVGAVKVSGGKVVDTFSTFVNPEIPIPANITKLTGITDEMVQDAPKIDTVLKDFMEFSKGCVLVAHNASFDVGFIKHNARLLDVKVENPVLDTLQLSRRMFPQLKRHKLNVVAEHLGVKLENHHRAVDDSMATAEIFIKCIEILKDKGACTVDDIDKVFGGEVDYKKADTYHAIILVKNSVGLKNLYKIISESHLKYYYKRPRVPKKLLMAHREGLILGSACEAGELYSAIVEKKSDEEIEKIARFYDYLEIQPLGNNQFMIANGTVQGLEDLKEINRKILRLGEKYDKPVVATCDVHFMDARDEVFRRILMAGKGFSDADNQAPLYFRTTGEMLDEFRYLGDEKAYEVVVTNTNLIADMIEEVPPVLPGTHPPKMEGAEDEIKMLAENTARELYGDPLPEIVQQRLDKELNSIIKNGFSVMYLIAQKLVHKSLSDGYLVGSRGSVGSSFVANMAGITEVNSLQPHYRCESCKYSEFITDGSYDCGFDLPDKNCPQCGAPLKKDGYDIPFETFLGFDGDKEPDIDLNFSGEYQPVIHKYTEELFGEGHVFRAGTIASVAEKTAFGYVKNYMEERGIVTSNAEMNRLVKGCTGVKRTTGQHPGGIMIVPSDKEIYDFSPVQHPADDTESDIITTHFDYNFLHGSILKLDILGHTVPTIIRMLEDLTGVNAQTIPINDPLTLSLFNSTEALGVKPEDIGSEVGTYAIPEFGTKFVKPMLLETMPKTVSELIRISGLSHGTDVWTGNAQELIRQGIAPLSQTICCRDDIMIYLMHKGLPPKMAFKIMEDVRKGKGLKDEYIEEMMKNNVPGWYIESCQKIKYMFPKAHAAAYVMMALRIAWFKVHYPKAFYATYFSVAVDDFDADFIIKGRERIQAKIKELEQKPKNDVTQKDKDLITILEVANEMFARGIKLHKVDLYNSDAVKFQVTEDGIRPPLLALQGLGRSAAQNIVEARKDGEFLSLDDLRIRAKVTKAVIEILQQHGCLEGVPETNQLSLF